MALIITLAAGGVVTEFTGAAVISGRQYWDDFYGHLGVSGGR